MEAWLSSLLYYIFITIFWLILCDHFVLQPLLDDRRRKGLPPGPIGLPLLGYLPFLASDHRKHQLQQLFQEYGKIVSLRLGCQDVVLVSDYEVIKEINDKEELLDRPASMSVGGSSSTMFQWNGQEWKEQRKICETIMRHIGAGRQEFEEMVMQSIDCLSQRIKQENQPINVTREVHAWASDVMYNMMTGRRHLDDDRTRQLISNYCKSQGRHGDSETGLSMIALQSFSPLLTGLMTRLPFSRAHADLKLIREHLKAEVRRHQETRSSNNNQAHHNISFIHCYLTDMQSSTAKARFADEDRLLGICLPFLVHGATAMASCLSHFVLLMMTHADVQQRMQKEIDGVIGRHRPSLMFKDQMPFTAAVMQELFRLSIHDPFGYPRQVSRDVQLQQYLLPEGTHVFRCNYTVHMDPECFERPEVFDPQRFLSSEGKYMRDERVTAFGSDMRSCVGEANVTCMMFLFMISMLQRFTIEIPQGMRVTLSSVHVLLVSRA